MSDEKKIIDKKRTALEQAIKKMRIGNDGTCRINVEIADIFIPTPLSGFSGIAEKRIKSVAGKLTLEPTDSDPKAEHIRTVEKALSAIITHCRGAIFKRLTDIKRNDEGNIDIKITLATLDLSNPPREVVVLQLKVEAATSILTLSTKRDTVLPNILSDVEDACDNAMRMIHYLLSGR
ncbi:hypothetical protein [Komagataeibacter oboediens]|uniref:hypothetical protein n=1 Tax=Komagataeibacter oboediens TaxID=65958 RepID=UPI0012F4BD2B|nr:hypothetical protein [Komagataeibacter oboediens]